MFTFFLSSVSAFLSFFTTSTRQRISPMAAQSTRLARKSALSRFHNADRVAGAKRKESAKMKKLLKKQQDRTAARLHLVEARNHEHVNEWGTATIPTQCNGFARYWRPPTTLGEHMEEFADRWEQHLEDLKAMGYMRCNRTTCNVIGGPNMMDTSEPEKQEDESGRLDPKAMGTSMGQAEESTLKNEDKMEIDNDNDNSNAKPATVSWSGEMDGLASHSTTTLSTPSTTLTNASTAPTPATVVWTPSPPSMGLGISVMMADTPSKPPTVRAGPIIMMPAPVKKPGTFLNTVPRPIMLPAAAQTDIVPTASLTSSFSPLSARISSRTAQTIVVDATNAIRQSMPTSSNPTSTYTFSSSTAAAATTSGINAHSAVLPSRSTLARDISITQTTSSCTASPEECKDALAVATTTATLPSCAPSPPTSLPPSREDMSSLSASMAKLTVTMAAVTQPVVSDHFAAVNLPRNAQLKKETRPANAKAAMMMPPPPPKPRVKTNLLTTTPCANVVPKSAINKIGANHNADAMEVSTSATLIAPSNNTTLSLVGPLAAGGIGILPPCSSLQKRPFTLVADSTSPIGQKRSRQSAPYKYTPTTSPSASPVLIAGATATATATATALSSAQSASVKLKSSDSKGDLGQHSQDQTPTAPKTVLRLGWKPQSWNRDTDEPKGSATWNKVHKAPAEWKRPIQNLEVGENHESEYLEDLNRARDLLAYGENLEKSTRKVQEIFEEVYELCRARDEFVDTSGGQVRQVASVDMLCSQGLGAHVAMFQPRKAEGISQRELDTFEDDLIAIQNKDPLLWEHLIGALLQRNCTLEQLLVDVPNDDGSIDKDWDIFQIVLDTKASLDWEINWRRIDDVSAKIRYGVSQGTVDFYTATTLPGTSRKDFNIIVDMVTSKGYFAILADQVKQWGVTRQTEFLRIVHRAGFGDPDELDDMANLVKWVKSVCMYEHGNWEENILACIAARYPQWYDRCGDGVEEDD